MKPEEILFNAMTPHLSGMQSDLLMACGGLILLALIVTCFVVLRDALFVDHHAREADEAQKQYDIFTREDASPYDRDVARTKYRRLVHKGAAR